MALHILHENTNLQAYPLTILLAALVSYVGMSRLQLSEFVGERGEK